MCASAWVRVCTVCVCVCGASTDASGVRVENAVRIVTTRAARARARRAQVGGGVAGRWRAVRAGGQYMVARARASSSGRGACGEDQGIIARAGQQARGVFGCDRVYLDPDFLGCWAGRNG